MVKITLIKGSSHGNTDDKNRKRKHPIVEIEKEKKRRRISSQSETPWGSDKMDTESFLWESSERKEVTFWKNKGGVHLEVDVVKTTRKKNDTFEVTESHTLNSYSKRVRIAQKYNFKSDSKFSNDVGTEGTHEQEQKGKLADRKRLQIEKDNSIQNILDVSSSVKPAETNHETEQIVIDHNIQRQEILEMKKMRAYHLYKMYELDLLLLNCQDEKYFSGQKFTANASDSDEDIIFLESVPSSQAKRSK